MKNLKQLSVQHTKKMQESILSLSLIDFELSLSFSEIECRILNVNPNDFDSLPFIEKLLTQHPELIDRIILSSKNNLITSLIYINKTSRIKIPIELISFGRIKYDNDELFLKNVIKKRQS